MLQFSELFSNFSQFGVFINAFTLSPLNVVFSRFFMNHIDELKLFDAFQHIQKNCVQWNIFMAIEQEP